jgi:1-acyl-sn-glycerol-3-phosphate acyltransferase
VRRIANGLFTPFWTAGVTVGAIALARAVNAPRYVQEGERFWARGLLNAWGVSVTTEGKELFPLAQPLIVMSNHQSHADVPILFASLPTIPGFLAKRELDKVPFLSMALRFGGHVLIDRSNRVSAMRALKDAAEEIASGKTIAVFPEGTRGDKDELLPFKKGGFMVAKKAGVAVVPVGILGSRHILPRDDLWPRPGEVTVRIGTPIAAEEVRTLSSTQLSQRVRGDIKSLLGWSAA